MGRNCADFHIIGNVARVAKLDKVTKVTIAANMRAKINNEWKDDTHYNTVNVWDENDRDYIESEIKVGDLVRATGRIRESSYQDGKGETNYAVDLHARDLSRRAKKTEKPE